MPGLSVRASLAQVWLAGAGWRPGSSAVKIARVTHSTMGHWSTRGDHEWGSARLGRLLSRPPPLRAHTAAVPPAVPPSWQDVGLSAQEGPGPVRQVSTECAARQPPQRARPDGRPALAALQPGRRLVADHPGHGPVTRAASRLIKWPRGSFSPEACPCRCPWPASHGPRARRPHSCRHAGRVGRRRDGREPAGRLGAGAIVGDGRTAAHAHAGRCLPHASASGLALGHRRRGVGADGSARCRGGCVAAARARAPPARLLSRVVSYF